MTKWRRREMNSLMLAYLQQIAAKSFGSVNQREGSAEWIFVGREITASVCLSGLSGLSLLIGHKCLLRPIVNINIKSTLQRKSAPPPLPPPPPPLGCVLLGHTEAINQIPTNERGLIFKTPSKEMKL